MASRGAVTASVTASIARPAVLYRAGCRKWRRARLTCLVVWRHVRPIMLPATAIADAARCCGERRPDSPIRVSLHDEKRGSRRVVAPDQTERFHCAEVLIQRPHERLEFAGEGGDQQVRNR